MLTVNLFDTAFSHLSCSVHGKTAKRIRYVRSNLTWDGITLLTDDMLCNSRTLEVLKSRVKIGWLLEPRDYKPENYQRVIGKLDRLDLLLTHDQRLLDAYPDKARFAPFGGCWIQEENFRLHPKQESPKACQILSGKMFMEGHRLRHEIARRFPEIECYGWGSSRGRFTCKDPILRPYQFSVVVENSRAHNFFTEKLLDCFAVGTVPIYWGCLNVHDFFHGGGVIQFSGIEELPDILSRLDYSRPEHQEGIRENLERMRQYEITDDWIAANVLEKLA